MGRVPPCLALSQCRPVAVVHLNREAKGDGSVFDAGRNREAGVAEDVKHFVILPQGLSPECPHAPRSRRPSQFI